MSLVNELQEVAESQDILTVLRKAKRVSAKLGRNDICNWIKNELDGYSNISDIPKYRQITCGLVLRTNGHVQIGFGLLGNGVERLPHIMPMPTPIYESITILATAVSSTEMLVRQVSPEAEAVLKSWAIDRQSSAYHQVSVLLEIPRPDINCIIQSIRDIVLDWAIKLEQEGILGENQTFSSNEKSKASQVYISIGDHAVVGAIGSDAVGDANLET